MHLLLVSICILFPIFHITMAERDYFDDQLRAFNGVLDQLAANILNILQALTSRSLRILVNAIFDQLFTVFLGI